MRKYRETVIPEGPPPPDNFLSVCYYCNYSGSDVFFEECCIKIKTNGKTGNGNSLACWNIIQYRMVNRKKGKEFWSELLLHHYHRHSPSLFNLGDNITLLRCRIGTETATKRTWVSDRITSHCFYHSIHFVIKDLSELRRDDGKRIYDVDLTSHKCRISDPVIWSLVWMKAGR